MKSANKKSAAILNILTTHFYISYNFFLGWGIGDKMPYSLNLVIFLETKMMHIQAKTMPWKIRPRKFPVILK